MLLQQALACRVAHTQARQRVTQGLHMLVEA